MIKRERSFEGLGVTIHTNSNCTCKCSYCYETNKAAAVDDDKSFWKKTKHSDKHRSYDFALNKCKARIIDIEKVYTFIDQVLSFPNTDFFKKYIINKDALIIDFIGGDSLQYPEILDKTLAYLNQQLIKKDHYWKYNWRCSISSNGVSLLNPEARKFCEKWRNNISLGLSIDGCPELHDLNRWCFADNADGSHMGSWQYIKEIWPWYKKTFPNDCNRTKWTLAPNSYKYILKSVKFLHEELGMTQILFNRVMENEIQDSLEHIEELMRQFESLIDYVVEHHNDIFCSSFDFRDTVNKRKSDLLKEDLQWTRCGFGKMPTLSFDGKVYPCFRMVPGSNHIKNSERYRQGIYNDILENEEVLVTLNKNCKVINMKNEDKCENCKLFSTCPHCAADCVGEDDILTKTTSVCNYTRLQVYYARKYWERIKSLHPDRYIKYRISWTQEDQDELIDSVLKDINNMKENKK